MNHTHDVSFDCGLIDHLSSALVDELHMLSAERDDIETE